MINSYLQNYYRQPAEVLRRRQACFAGPKAEFLPWLQGYVDAGASHLMVRVVGDHESHIGILAKVRDALN